MGRPAFGADTAGKRNRSMRGTNSAPQASKTPTPNRYARCHNASRGYCSREKTKSHSLG